MKVARDAAEADFERFITLNSIDFDRPNMTEEDRESRAEQSERIIGAIMDGSLIVTDDGDLVYTPQKGNTSSLTFTEPTGAALMSTRSGKKDEVARLYGVMAEMTSTDAKTFSAMKMSDLKVCMSIATLFLA